MDLLKYEKELYKQGYELIGGVDEVGRGPLIGPVVASCVILPKNYKLDGLTDSKKLSEKKREYFYDIILRDALGVGVGIVDNKIIDEINIYQATKKAMIEAIKDVGKKIDYILVDGNMKLDIDIPNVAIVKGDSKSLSIAAASVIAKVIRDKMMYELDKIYPMYEFGKHKGYPTKKHIEAINIYGILEEHRRSYKPIADLSNK